eukprot:11918915-Heterocapsa_arctica.AAC.1
MRVANPPGVVRSSLSPLYWQEQFANKLCEIGYQRSIADPQLFWHPEDGTIIVAHVDDLLITGKDDALKIMKEDMSNIFKLKWGGEFEKDKWVKFLGKEWRRGE